MAKSKYSPKRSDKNIIVSDKALDISEFLSIPVVNIETPLIGDYTDYDGRFLYNKLDKKLYIRDGNTWQKSTSTLEVFETLSEFTNKYPIEGRSEGQLFWVRSVSDSNKADLYALRGDKTPYKVLEDIDLSDYYTSVQTDNKIIDGVESGLNNELSYNPLTSSLVSFTIDNVSINVIEQVLPMFKTKGVKGGINVTTSNLRRLGRADGVYSWDGVGAAITDGWEIGVRSESGVTLNAGTSLEEGEENFKNAKQQIQAYGYNANYFIAPSTDYDPKFDGLAEEYYAFGFTQGYASVATSGNTSQTNRFRLKRISFENGMTVAQAKAFIDQAISDNSYVCFYFHDVLPSTLYPLSPTLSMLTELVDYAIANSTVVTPTEALSKLNSSVIAGSAIKQTLNTLRADVNTTSGLNFCVNPMFKNNAQGWTFDKSATAGSPTFSPSFSLNVVENYIGSCTVIANNTVNQGEIMFITQSLTNFVTSSLKQTLTFSTMLQKQVGANSLTNNNSFVRMEFYNGATLLETHDSEVFQDKVGGVIGMIYVTATPPDATTIIKLCLCFIKNTDSTQIGTTFLLPKLEIGLSPSKFTDNTTALVAGPYVRLNLGSDAVGDIYYAAKAGATTGLKLFRLAAGTVGQVLGNQTTADGVTPRWVTPANSINQGGNAFGANVVIGATDAFGIQFITAGVSRATLLNSGLFINVPIFGASGANATINPSVDGTVITRNQPDNKTNFTAKQVNTLSTGNIFEFINALATKIFKMDYLGHIFIPGSTVSVPAWLNLPPGDGTTAPFKWSGGNTLKPTPEAYDEEVDVNGRYFTIASYAVSLKYAMTGTPDLSTTASVSKSYLNTTYPYAKVGFSKDFPSLSGGAIVARKLDDSPTGDWLLIPAMLAV